MQVKDTLFYNKRTINCNGKIIDLANPKLMAIINITPDSFYDKSRYNTEDQIRQRTIQCIEEGADIIDVGAYSSRPGASDITAKEEISRLDKALKIIRKISQYFVISVDTFRSEVARYIIQNYAVNIINDISGGQLDEKIYEVALKENVSYIAMHMKGNPQNMQNNPKYNDVVTEIITYFAYLTEKLNKIGLNDVIIDPGFGFGKTLDHNYEILNKLQDIKKMINRPLLAGISRKSMIYKLLNVTPEESLTGCIALNMTCLMNGADILRVHDVKETKQVIQLYNSLNKR